MGESTAVMQGLRGIVLSDAHFFAGHSRRAQKVFTQLAAQLNQYDVCILNGDMLEALVPGMFLPDVAAACVQKVRQFCQQAAQVNPDCVIHYVIGNHEATPDFIQRIQSLTGEMPNLRLHLDKVQIGDALFLHGDMPLYHRKLEGREPAAPYVKGVGGFLTALYSPLQELDAIIRARTIPVILAVRSIARVLAADPAADSARHVFFGHTHRALFGLQEAGRTYYNTGAFSDGAQALPLAFRLDAEQRVTSVEPVDLGIPDLRRRWPGLTDLLSSIRLTQAVLQERGQAGGASRD